MVTVVGVVMQAAAAAGAAGSGDKAGCNATTRRARKLVTLAMAAQAAGGLAVGRRMAGVPGCNGGGGGGRRELERGLTSGEELGRSSFYRQCSHIDQVPRHPKVR